MTKSTQHTLDKIRPPRVQLTYDVEIGNAIIMKQLPFVVGILADLAGIPENAREKLKDRKFVDIDRDNFNEVMSKIAPRLPLRVPNVLSDSGDELNVLLNFENIEDFNPVNVAKQVPALAALLEARHRLSDLLSKLDGNDTLDSLLRQVLSNPDIQKQLQDQVKENSNSPDAKPGDVAPAK